MWPNLVIAFLPRALFKKHLGLSLKCFYTTVPGGAATENRATGEASGPPRGLRTRGVRGCRRGGGAHFPPHSAPGDGRAQDGITVLPVKRPGCAVEGATVRLHLEVLGWGDFWTGGAPDSLSPSFLICQTRTVALSLPTSHSCVRTTVTSDLTPCFPGAVSPWSL